MKLIPLTKGKFAMVDDEDYEYINKYKWSLSCGYAARNTKDIYSRSMHRLIMKAEPGQMIDHKDRDRLNNQKINLRFCTWGQNMANRKKKKGASDFLGVWLHVSKFRYTYKSGVTKEFLYPKWGARITSNKKVLFLGYFEIEADAAKAYNQAAIKYHGEFAKLNEI